MIVHASNVLKYFSLTLCVQVVDVHGLREIERLVDTLLFPEVSLTWTRKGSRLLRGRRSQGLCEEPPTPGSTQGAHYTSRCLRQGHPRQKDLLRRTKTPKPCLVDRLCQDFLERTCYAKLPGGKLNFARSFLGKPVRTGPPQGNVLSLVLSEEWDV